MDCEAVGRVRAAVGAWPQPRLQQYLQHDWNIQRWITAYEGDEQETIKVLSRHLNNRDTMGLCDLPESEPACPIMEKHAPLSILGRNHPDDNKVTLWELTGQLDIHGLVENIRISPFMKSRFRWMEMVHREVVKEEQRTGKQSGGLLVMDLKHLRFSPSLLSVIGGPYRIMWGTLFEQYPQMIQEIVIINAPTFVNLLYQTCIPFIPADYKSKITICSSSSPSITLIKRLHPSILPTQYVEEESPHANPDIPKPVSPFPRAEPLTVQLDSVSVPAGGRVYLKLRLEADETLSIYTKHEQEMTVFWFYSKEDTKNVSSWREIIAGCERPALSTIDRSRWVVPLTTPSWSLLLLQP
ncbi:hypothetical protein PFISCL1PPCAC_8123 [Pristionchus fissidentatus]|uniref:CRAL-TRIO domain-containing protein n=1 Tax=Pristionchus fissidentatus TaxID=1538716 RepID=A0AAV5VBQ7_9BILA|nr:hypothetical protein PFISCL1PPCAC_8123 [Pristionchus fissidentatus]